MEIHAGGDVRIGGDVTGGSKITTLLSSYPPEVQTEAATLIRELEAEKPREGFIKRRLRNLGHMAPELLEVFILTFTNPIAGIGLSLAKLAEYAAEEAEKV